MMLLLLSKFKTIGLLSLLLLAAACGRAPDSTSGQGNTGSYSPRLVFPENASQKENVSKALTGFDCAENGVATIEFNFIVNGQQNGPHTFPCTDRHARIEGIPAGKAVTVEVYADDGNGEAVYQGSEVVDIIRDQVTQSGEIQMQYATFTNDFGMQFVRVPAANRTFTMGSPEGELGHEDDETEHQVTLSADYYMMVTEVTQAQWRAVWDAAEAAGITIPPGRNPSEFANCDNCPVDSVSWEDTRQFITALTTLEQLGQGAYNLPSEAQWEFAARGKTTSALPMPNGELTYTDCTLDDQLKRIAWYCGNANDSTHPVKGKEPNVYGLYDMHGNVYEWCRDWYGAYPTSSVTDPLADSPSDSRVLRGGSWLFGASYCRSAYRSSSMPDDGSRDNGFRLAAPLSSR